MGKGQGREGVRQTSQESQAQDECRRSGQDSRGSQSPVGQSQGGQEKVTESGN